MTVPVRIRTLTVPDKLFTAAEFFALGDDDSLRNLELQEGSLVMASSPTVRHMRAVKRLIRQLDAAPPAGLEVLFEIDVDLQLVAADRPGTVRKPDVVVVATDEVPLDRLLPAGAVRLAVEIVSPSSRRTHLRIQRDEYADAGIPHYWVIDLDPRPSLRAFVLESGGYRDAEPVTGTVGPELPFPVRLDLDALV